MYVKCSEDSERKKRKSPFSTTPISFDVEQSGSSRASGRLREIRTSYDEDPQMTDASCKHNVYAIIAMFTFMPHIRGVAFNAHTQH